MISLSYNYIISSDDAYAVTEKIEEIKKSFDYELEYTSYDLEDDGLYSLVDEITTVSLFQEPKLIVCRSCEKLIDAKEKAFNELVVAMNDINSQNVLIFVFLKHVDYNNERIAKFRKYASLIDIRLKNISFDDYIKQELNKDNFIIDDNALSLLVSYTTSLAMLKTTLDQLKCYKKEEKRITDKDIKTLVPIPLDDNVYDLVDAVLNNDKKRMFQSFKDLKLQSIQASYLVSLLINKFQELYNVSILTKSNVSQAEIASLFNVSSGRAYYMVKNAKANNISKIKRNLELLNKLDLDIKTGKIEQNLGLELYFLN